METWNIEMKTILVTVSRVVFSITPSLHHPSPIPRMSWNRKHLLDIESLTPEEIVTVLDTARAFRAVGERAIKKVPALRGKTVINLLSNLLLAPGSASNFSEQRLSADIINFTAEASSLKKARRCATLQREISS
jgi:aspartate carbamoyltransferase catalytic subunit